MSPRQPFDREEAELAAQLAELPQSAPSAALDQRILQAARQAARAPTTETIAASPRQSRPRPRSWHWAGAAAAALALWISVPQWRDRPAEMAEPTEVSEGFVGETADSVSAEAPASPTADAEAPDRQALDTPTVGSQEARRAAPAAPAPAAAPVDKPAPPLPAAAPQMRAEALPAIKQAKAGRGLALEVDERLPQIRALLEAGEKEAARRALRELMEAHPDWSPPEDLRELLGESPR